MGSHFGSRLSSFFCNQHLAMKYLLVVSLLQKASASTTGAPSPSIPAASGTAVTMRGNFVVGCGTCNNAQACSGSAPCVTNAMNTLKTQANLPSTPTGTASTPGCSGGRRLSENELQEIFSRMVVSATPRKLAAGDLQLDYSFTATTGQQAALSAVLSGIGTDPATKASFLTALKTALTGVSGFSTTSLSIESFSAPTSTPSTTASQVSAAVGSQATLPAVALLLACFT